MRAAVGTSVAPPYINLLNNNGIVNAAPIVPPPYYTTTVNSGDVLPETAFGFDVGFDTRLHSPYTVLSVDLYQTLLHNEFLQQTSQQGTYTCPPGSFYAGNTGPLYVTKTANLGHSEYEGVELTLHRTPPTGWGYGYRDRCSAHLCTICLPDSGVPLLGQIQPIWRYCRISTFNKQYLVLTGWHMRAPLLYGLRRSELSRTQRSLFLGGYNVLWAQQLL